MKKLLILYPYCNYGGVASVIKQRLPILKKLGWQVDCIFMENNGGGKEYIDSGVKTIYFISGEDFASELVKWLSGNDYYCANIIDWPIAISSIKKAKPSLPMLYEIHTPYDSVMRKNNVSDLLSCGKILVPSKWSKKLLLSIFEEPELKENVIVLDNLINEEFFSEPRLLGSVLSSRSLIWVGKLNLANDYKNAKEAIEIAKAILASHSDVVLYWITGGNKTIADDDYFLYKMKAYLGRVVTLHNISADDLAAIYSSSAKNNGVFYTTSKLESFCLVVHEAMQMGLPVVSTGSTAMGDYLSHDENCLLYESGSVSAAAGQISMLLDDEELHLRLSQAGIEFRSNFHDSINYERRLEKILFDVSGSFSPNNVYSIRSEQKLKVGCIMDEFTYINFSFEANLHYLTPENFNSTIQAGVDFVFIESVWAGLNNEWEGVLSDKANIDVFLRVIARAKELNIPVVFWNKEDPLHFDRFSHLYEYFDFIFTTDEGCVESYKRIAPKVNVGVLPFAMQPKIHNPISKREISSCDTIFAGTWYQKFKNRNDDFDKIINEVYDLGSNLTIYERTSGRRKEAAYSTTFKWPERYTDRIRPALDQYELLSAYKSFKIGVNLNTVQDSETMCARRVFEMLGCGLPVVSNDSLALKHFFSELVLRLGSSRWSKENIRKLFLDDEYRHKLSHDGWREVNEHHTYKHRLDTILLSIGVKSKKEKDVFSEKILVVCSNDLVLENIDKKVDVVNISKFVKNSVGNSLDDKYGYVLFISPIVKKINQEMIGDLILAFFSHNKYYQVKAMPDSHISWEFVSLGVYPVLMVKLTHAAKNDLAKVIVEDEGFNINQFKGEALVVDKYNIDFN